jgi:hypothetical protein
MTKLGILVGGIAALAFVSATMARGPGGGRTYDPRTVETLRGDVASVETVTGAKGRSGGVHLAVRTDRETVSVHLGPAWWVEKQKLHIAKGDAVEVRGSRITYDGKPAVIAREVTKGGDTLVLRNEAGVPVWAGRGPR